MPPSIRLTMLGSLVADLVSWLPHLPQPGEAQHPTRFEIFAGGKGFNQALTAKRCGAELILASRVGDDSFGQMFFDTLAREGIDPRFVTRHPAGTNLCLLMHDAHGHTSLIGIPRASLTLTLADVQAVAAEIAQSQVLMLQLEIPLAVSQAAAQVAHAHDARVILNPSPGQMALADFSWIDWLIPNEHEAARLVQHPVATVAEARQAAHTLLAHGVRQGVVVTLGQQGALALTRAGEVYAPAFPVTVVDAVGAGDAFMGAFAVALAEGQPLEQAVRFANAAGALCVTVAGAEPSLPRRAAIEKLLA